MFKLLNKNPKGLTGPQIRDGLKLSGIPNILRDEFICADPPRIRRLHFEGVRGVTYQITAAGKKAITSGTHVVLKPRSPQQSMPGAFLLRSKILQCDFPVTTTTHGGLMSISYQVKKKAIGGYAVTYDCPHCATGLTSALNEAGTSQPCPTCNKPFVVPGKAELDQLRMKEEAQRRAKAQQDQENARQQQLAVQEFQRQRDQETAEEEARRLYRESHCPFCFEEIRPGVKKCKHCHEWIDQDWRKVAADTEVVGVKIPVSQMVWLVVNFWVASLLIVIAGWIAVFVIAAAIGISAGPFFNR